ncbi:DinB family protein [Chitinophaga sp. GCM10012297]|uniref:DinB family protein n=1 Tax=Chitinophaga chungangae TaxID=2821488 RepID=A0ABS3Y9A3_9BACT|nr:DinB family protein [Chitinophaga chungangae]MBO9151267.1 DinB family protein [Chitinophaga chungangae]
MEADIRIAADDAITEMAGLLASCSQEQANRVPFSGSWTAAQVVEHMRISISGCIELLQGGAKPTTHRSPDAKVPDLQVFLDYNIKMESPDFVQPEDKIYDKEALSKEMEKLRRELNGTLGGKDLNETLTGFDFPFLGELTRTELVHFVAWHTTRHNRQLRKIVGVLKGGEA